MDIERTELESDGSSREYILTLDPNGGFVVESGREYENRLTTQPYAMTVAFDQNVGNLPEPKRPGYDFQGWYKTKSGFWDETSGYPFKDQIKLEESTKWQWNRDATFEARWEARECNLKWDPNGGDWSSTDDIELAYNSNTLSEVRPYGWVIGNTTYFSKTPTRNGYDFIGWYTLRLDPDCGIGIVDSQCQRNA